MMDAPLVLTSLPANVQPSAYILVAIFPQRIEVYSSIFGDWHDRMGWQIDMERLLRPRLIVLAVFVVHEAVGPGALEVCRRLGEQWRRYRRRLIHLRWVSLRTVSNRPNTHGKWQQQQQQHG